MKESYVQFDRLMKLYKDNLDSRVEKCLQNGNMERVEILKKCYGWSFSYRCAAAQNLAGLGCIRIEDDEVEDFKAFMEEHRWKHIPRSCMQKVTSINKKMPELCFGASDLLMCVDSCIKACSEDAVPVVQLANMRQGIFNARYLKIMLEFLGTDTDVEVSTVPYEWPSAAYKGIPLYIFNSKDPNNKALYYLSPISASDLEDMEHIMRTFTPTASDAEDDDPLSFFF